MPATTTDRRQLVEIDGKTFLFQHGYRFGKVTYITRLPLSKSMTVFTPGHLSASEVEALVLPVVARTPFRDLRVARSGSMMRLELFRET